MDDADTQRGEESPFEVDLRFLSRTEKVRLGDCLQPSGGTLPGQEEYSTPEVTEPEVSQTCLNRQWIFSTHILADPWIKNLTCLRILIPN